MCGLIGAAGQLTAKEEKMVRTMLVLDTVRGEDSTGVAIIPRIGDITVAKELGNPYELFESRKYIAGMRKANRVIIGHNRFATSGGVSRHTAHPFDFESLVGCHNGTLTNKWRLDDASFFKVDSENLYHHMEKNGLRALLDIMEGAWALVWWNKENETLNFLRNKERPFYMAPNKEGTCVFWASEEWMLDIAAAKSGVALGDITITEVDMHYSIPISVTAVIGKPTVHKYPSKVVIPNVTYFPGKGMQHQKKPDTIHPPMVQISDKKKENITPCGTPLRDYYSERKDLILEVVGEGMDEFGGRYMMLMDTMIPATTIRLYYNKMDDPIKRCIGLEILCEVAGVNMKNDKLNYVRINPHTYEVITIPENGAITLYETGLGTLVTAQEWESYHRNCDWCFDVLHADDKANMLLANGSCYCGVCASDPVKVEGMKMKSVF